jgi:hypothetical protein
LVLAACLSLAPQAFAQNYANYAGYVFSNTLCKLISGSATPTTEGNNCDVYIKTNGVIYTKAGGTWTAVGGVTGSGTGGYLTGWTGTSTLGATGLTYTTSEITGGTWNAGAGTFTGHVLPSVTDTYDLGSATRFWRQGYLSQLNAVLFAKETISLFGGWQMVTKNAGVFAAAVGSGDTTINFGTAMVADQFVLVRAADTGGTITAEYVKVVSLVSGTTYNVTRNLSGGGAKNWAMGVPFAVLGVAGDGWVEQSAYTTPRLSVWKQGSAYNNSTELVRVGELGGFLSIPSNKYGFAAGDATNYLKYYDGVLSIAGSLAIGYVTVNSAGVSVATSTTPNVARAYAFDSNADAMLYGYGTTSTVREIGLVSTDSSMPTNRILLNAGNSGSATLGHATITLEGGLSGDTTTFLTLNTRNASNVITDLTLNNGTVAVTGAATFTGAVRSSGAVTGSTLTTSYTDAGRIYWVKTDATAQTWLAAANSATWILYDVTAGYVAVMQLAAVTGAATFPGGVTANITGNVTGSSGSTTGNAGTVTNGLYTGNIGSTVQAYSAKLTDIAALTATSDYIIVGNGSTWTTTTKPTGFPGASMSSTDCRPYYVNHIHADGNGLVSSADCSSVPESSIVDAITRITSLEQRIAELEAAVAVRR